MGQGFASSQGSSSTSTSTSTSVAGPSNSALACVSSDSSWPTAYGKRKIVGVDPDSSDLLGSKLDALLRQIEAEASADTAIPIETDLSTVAKGAVSEAFARNGGMDDESGWISTGKVNVQDREVSRGVGSISVWLDFTVANQRTITQGTATVTGTDSGTDTDTVAVTKTIGVNGGGSVTKNGVGGSGGVTASAAKTDTQASGTTRTSTVGVTGGTGEVMEADIMILCSVVFTANSAIDWVSTQDWIEATGGTIQWTQAGEPCAEE